MEMLHVCKLHLGVGMIYVFIKSNLNTFVHAIVSKPLKTGFNDCIQAPFVMMFHSVSSKLEIRDFFLFFFFKLFSQCFE